MAVRLDKVRAVSSGLNDLVRATFAVREFCNGASSSIAVDLHFGHDEIADSVSNLGAGRVGAFAVNGTALFG